MRISGSQIALALGCLLILFGLLVLLVEDRDPAISTPVEALAVFAAHLDNAQPAPAATGRFSCADAGQLTVDFHQGSPGGVALRLGSEQRLAVRIRSASGSRYQGGSVEFWEHGTEAMLTWDGRRDRCLAIPSDQFSSAV